MAKISLFLDTRRTGSGGSCPVTLKIQHKNTGGTYATGISIKPDQWDKINRLVINSRQSDNYNRTLLNIKKTWESALLLLIENGEVHGTHSASELKALLLRKIFPDADPEPGRKNLFLARFIAYMDSRATPGTRRVYRETLARMQDFDAELAERKFEDINAKWLRDFDSFMAATSPSANARAIKLRCIRAVFNDAIDDEVTTSYPFRKFKIRHVPTRKRALSVEQLRLLAGYQVELGQQQYRDMFVLMFCLIGINAKDLLLAKPDQIRDGRLEYIRAKTGKAYSIKIEPEAAVILRKYSGTGHLVNIMDRRTGNYMDWLRDMDCALKKIGPYSRHGLGGKKVYKPLFPELSQYWCRHTWATIAAGLDIPKETIAAALGHGGNSVTDIYIDFDRHKVDEANRRVLDYVFNE